MGNSESDHPEASGILPKISGLLKRPHPSLSRDLSAAVQPPQERKVKTNTMECVTGACILTAEGVPATRTSIKLPDLMKPFVLRTDASGAGVAAVLCKRMKESCTQ